MTDEIPEGATWYGFDPLPWQKKFIECDKREVLGSGAFGSGKSRALAEKMLLLLTLYPGNKGLLARNTLKALRGSTKKEFEDKVLPDAWRVDPLCNKQERVIAIQSPYYPASYCPREVCDFESDRRVHTETVTCPQCEKATLNAVPASLLYYDGLQTTGHGDIPENILSVEFGAIGVDECKDVTEEAWHALNGRLRLRDLNNPYVPELPIRTIFGATNPAGPSHWLYQKFFEQDSENRAVFQSKTADNVAGLNLDSYLENLVEQYGEDTPEAQRLIKGKWVGFEGLVFSEWDPETHEINPLDVEEVLGDDWHVENEDELVETRSEHSNPTGDPSKPGQYTPAKVYPPKNASIVMAVDWGYRPDPTTCLWFAMTDTHGLVLYRSYMKTRTLPDDVAKDVVSHMAPYEVNNVKKVYADHDPGNHKAWIEGAKEAFTGDASGATRETVPAVWRGKNDPQRNEEPNWRRLQTTNAKKDREEGVSEMKRAMRVDENGRAGFYVVKGNRCHQADIHLARDDKPTTFVDELRGYSYTDEESGEPQDYNDHMLDAARYAVMGTKSMTSNTGTTSTVISSSDGRRRRKRRR